MASRRADELLRQILANPEDDAARAVYADELLAAGDPRGELIALDLTRDPEHAGRRETLLATHARTWWPGLDRHRIATRGGFLDHVACDAGTLAAARDVFAREPVRRIELVDAHPDTFPLAEPAWQAHAIAFTAHGSFGRGVFALANAPLGDRLVTLDVGASDLDRGIEALGTRLPACTSLVLAGNRYLGRHLPKLLDWQRLGAIEHLDLSGTSMTPELLAELLARDLHSIRVLHLSGNPIGNLGPRLIADALPRMPQLAGVELYDCDIDEAAAAPLRDRLRRVVVAATDLPQMVVLDLVGIVLELVRLGDGQRRHDRWAIKLDGRPRTVRWRQVQRDDRAVAREGAWQLAEIAPLDRLAFALASHAPRELTVDGCTVGLPPSIGYVYNTSVYSSETVRVACSPAAATVAITFDEYTSTD